jgi:hypothetical protein
VLVFGLHLAVVVALWGGRDRSVRTYPSMVPIEIMSLAPPASRVSIRPGFYLVFEAPRIVAHFRPIKIEADSGLEISDVAVSDMRRLAACSGILAPLRRDNTEVSVTLLLQVDASSRISLSRVEHGSGNDSIDASVQRCVAIVGLVPPRDSNANRLSSWQRLRLVAPR